MNVLLSREKKTSGTVKYFLAPLSGSGLNLGQGLGLDSGSMHSSHPLGTGTPSPQFEDPMMRLVDPLTAMGGVESAGPTKAAFTVAPEIPSCSSPSSPALPPVLLERVVSFVPQTDVLLPEMTVRQLLTHSAQMRCSRDTTTSEVWFPELVLFPFTTLFCLSTLAVGV